MTDVRLHPGNGTYVLEGFDAQGSEAPVSGRIARLTQDVWLHRGLPSGQRDRECLTGDAVIVIEERDGQAFIRAIKDGYCGWIDADALGPDFTPTHFVAVRTTHTYPSADMKRPAVQTLHFGSRVAVASQDGEWAHLIDGRFVHAAHLRSDPMDVVEAARVFLGTPYVWAGNSGAGLDCSGLVQAAYFASGRCCPGDSDQQEAMAGEALPPDAALEAGDLVFWKGHVALVTGPDQIIHANAHHMQVVEERLSDAIERIAATETGPVTSRLRPHHSAQNTPG